MISHLEKNGGRDLKRREPKRSEEKRREAMRREMYPSDNNRIGTLKMADKRTIVAVATIIIQKAMVMVTENSMGNHNLVADRLRYDMITMTYIYRRNVRAG